MQNITRSVFYCKLLVVSGLFASEHHHSSIITHQAPSGNKIQSMSILQDNLSENPCYGVASDGTGYLEFSCVYGVEKYYGRYSMDVLFVHPRAVCERLVRAVLFFLTLTTRSLARSLSHYAVLRSTTMWFQSFIGCRSIPWSPSRHVWPTVH